MNHKLQQPIASDQLLFPKCVFANVDFIGGMHRGRILVKILYQAEPQPTDDPDQVRVICETYLHHHFVSAVDNFMNRAYLPQQASLLTLPVTGVGFGQEAINILSRQTCMKVKFVDPLHCQAEGTHWLIKNVNEKQLFHDDCLNIDNALDVIPTNSFYDLYRGDFFAAVDKHRSQFQDTLPCLVAFIGSETELVELKLNGDMKLAGRTMLGEITFLSLGKLLLQTGDYEEIMGMAENGNLCELDTLYGDMFVTGPGTDSGEIDPKEPLYPFGRACDKNNDLEAFRREDVAAALVRLVANSLATILHHALRATSHLRLYIGGSLGQRKLFRQWMNKCFSKNMLTSLRPYEVRYFKTAHIKAFGVMRS